MWMTNAQGSGVSCVESKQPQMPQNTHFCIVERTKSFATLCDSLIRVKGHCEKVKVSNEQEMAQSE